MKENDVFRIQRQIFAYAWFTADANTAIDIQSYIALSAPSDAELVESSRSNPLLTANLRRTWKDLIDFVYVEATAVPESLFLD